jgi:cob(I)alamin adenosyltransferase
MAFKIYTKTGDEGETGLFGGKRLPKHHLRIESYGTVDELNSWLGLLRDQAPQGAEIERDLLQDVQSLLFTLGSILASDPEKKMAVPELLPEHVEELERAIDRMDAALPALKNFILPGGHPLVSQCHIARCVCRRAERLVVALNEQEPLSPILVQYLNRLSDYLFTLARYFSVLLKAEEIPWVPARK